jgi:hypothetical protein
VILSWWDKTESGTGTTREGERQPNGQSIVLWRPDTLHPPSSYISSITLPGTYWSPSFVLRYTSTPPRHCRSSSRTFVGSNSLSSRKERNDQIRFRGPIHPSIHSHHPSIFGACSAALFTPNSWRDTAAPFPLHPPWFPFRGRRENGPKPIRSHVSYHLRGATRLLVSGALGFNTGIHRVGESVI